MKDLIKTPTHILKISGDTNDADYIDIEHKVNPKYPNRVFEPGELFKGSRSVNFMELIQALCNALHLPRKTRHTWSRDEYDDVSAAMETSEWVFTILAGFHPDDEEISAKIGEEEVYDAVRKIKEALSDNLPYGEIGIHTIESITLRPITSDKTLYSNPGYWKNQNIAKEHKRATIAVHFMDENEPAKDDIALYDTASTPFKLWNVKDSTWDDNAYESVDQFALYGGKIVKEFK
ncbi:hypothetical protein ABNavy71_120 [Acinetobacter phage AB-Navy71]|nr:hypothetical protein ABNavy71_120 [Acinetobacter phage AB-Navy71]